MNHVTSDKINTQTITKKIHTCAIVHVINNIEFTRSEHVHVINNREFTRSEQDTKLQPAALQHFLFTILAKENLPLSDRINM